jgi:hypothetical protein
MGDVKQMLPGEHPRSDQPNWRPAETPDEYMLNVREGLEKYTEVRMTKLLGLNRTQAWRAQLLTHIPKGLFDRLLKARVGSKQLAQVGLAIRRNGEGRQYAEIEYCPHCGEPVRVRRLIGPKASKVIDQWIDDGMPDNYYGDDQQTKETDHAAPLDDDNNHTEKEWRRAVVGRHQKSEQK